MKYPIYPITFFYVSGIFFSLYLRLPFSAVLVAFILSLLVLLFLYIQRKKGFHSKRNLFTLTIVCAVFASLGFLIHHFKNRHVIINDLTKQEFTLKVTEVLKSNAYSYRVYADLLSNDRQPSVLVSFSNKDSLPMVGAVYKLTGTIKEIPEPKNLYDFNYKKYLQNKYIHYQIHSVNSPIKIAEQPSLNSRIIHFRNDLVAQFSGLGYSNETKGFIEALLFGIKTNLQADIQQQFKDFGILHVLAVSGMHVVLLFSTISYVLRHLRIPKNAITIVLIVFLLIFSLMAGFSGSVVRAALMCLMTMVGTLTGRRVHTINLLVGSMLLILLVEPNYLFDVGFQLSYLAVFSIVYCYPVIQRYFTFKNWILNYFGQLVGVSLVAQLGVLPLSIYYFKQIPLLFLIGNIIAIPLTSVLLIGWFVQMVLSLISLPIAVFFTPVLDYISTFCFDTLTRLSDYFSIKTMDYHLSFGQTITALLLIFSIFWFLKKKKIEIVFLCVGSIVMFQLITIHQAIRNKNKQEIIVMSDTKEVVLLNREKNQVHQLGIANGFTKTAIQNYILQTHVKRKLVDSLKNAFTLNNESWLIIDSLSVYPKKSFDYVILCQNPKLNLERLIKNVQPKLIILHNSNYHYLIDEYKAYFDQRKIPYYDMKSKGSFVINYN